MNKKYLQTSVCLASILYVVFGSHGSPANAMMSETAAEDLRKVVARPCSFGDGGMRRGYVWPGHKPKLIVPRGAVRNQYASCTECVAAGARLKAHEAAKESVEEETELRKELLRAQIAAVKKSNEPTFEELKAQAEKIMKGMGPPPK
ncbi:MAG: hypothetical protein WCK49_08560 [Myxococcaceae bacterium]